MDDARKLTIEMVDLIRSGKTDDEVIEWLVEITQFEETSVRKNLSTIRRVLNL